MHCSGSLMIVWLGGGKLHQGYPVELVQTDELVMMNVRFHSVAEGLSEDDYSHHHWSKSMECHWKVVENQTPNISTHHLVEQHSSEQLHKYKHGCLGEGGCWARTGGPEDYKDNLRTDRGHLCPHRTLGITVTRCANEQLGLDSPCVRSGVLLSPRCSLLLITTSKMIRTFLKISAAGLLHLPCRDK